MPHRHDTFPAAQPKTEAMTRSPAESDFARFFELSLDLFCIANLEGFFVRVNRNFTKILGYPENELLSQPFLEFVHPDDYQATVLEMERLREGMSVVRFRNRYRDQAGQYHIFEWTANAAEGLVYAVARDHSEQFRLLDELTTNRKRERAILDRTPAVIYVKGVDHQYQFINQQFAELFHVDTQEIIGKDDHYLFTSDIAAQVMANDDEVVSSGDAVTVEEYVPHDDGLHTYISVKFPLVDAQGVITAVAGISTDISDRLRANEAEQELQLAHAFQRTLYPEVPPEIEGLEIAGAAFPIAHVCGDYYDYIKLDAHRLAISVGDVAGHGYKPALQMVELRSSLRILLRTSSSLQVAVENLNEILCDDFSAVPSFVSFFVASIDVKQRLLRYIGAGHEGFIVKGDGRLMSLPSTGLVIGVRPGEFYREGAQIDWEAGDILIVFTDGFSEAFNRADEQFGRDRVLAALTEKRHCSPRDMINNLFQRVKEHVGRVSLQDDMTVVVVKATM